MNRRFFMKLFSSIGLLPTVATADDNPTSLPTVKLDGKKVLNEEEIFGKIPYKIRTFCSNSNPTREWFEKPPNADLSVYNNHYFTIRKETNVWLPEKNKVIFLGQENFYFWGEVTFRQNIYLHRKEGAFFKADKSIIESISASYQMGYMF